MRFSDIIKFSFGNLRKRKSRTILTTLGIAVGTVLIVTLLSIGIGTENAIMKSAREETDNKTITVHNKTYYDISELSQLPDDEAVAQFYEDRFKKIDDSAIDKFNNITGVNFVQAKLNTGVDTIRIDGAEKSDRFNVVGVNTKYSIFSDDDIARVRTTKNNNNLQPIIAGRTLNESDTNSALIGEPYLKKLNITDYNSVIGKEISLIQEKTADGLIRLKPLEIKLKIVGVIEESFILEDSGIIVQTEIASKFKGRELEIDDYFDTKGYDTVMLHANTSEDVINISASIKSMDYALDSLVEVAKRVSNSFKQIKMILASFAVIVVFIATISIINTMVMSVYERTRSIGVMKALGATSKDINYMFITESGLIGFLGGGVGVVLSKVIIIIMGISSNGLAQNVNTAPVGLLTISAFTFSVVVSILSGIYPANRASNLNPIEALSSK